MYISRCYDNLSKIDFEESEKKKIVPIEIFCMNFLQEVGEVKYFYNNMLIGAIDSVSHKRQIKCKESYKEVFDFIGKTLRELGW